MARILGLDISNTAVRGAVLRTALRQTEIEQYIEEPIIADGEDAENDTRAAVQRALAAIPRPPDTIVACLDGTKVSLRTVALPAGAAKRITEVLPFELEPLLPFEIEDAVVDHQPIARDSEGIRVLAAAAPRNHVASRLEELSSIGVDPRQLAIGPAALDGLAGLLPSEEEGPWAVLHVADDAIDLCILKEGHCELARTISGDVSELEHPQPGRLASAVQRTIAGYRAEGGSEITSVYLSGNIRSLSNTQAWAQSVFEVPCAPLPLPITEDVLPETIYRFGRAAALAGRGMSSGKRFDLRQGEFASTHTASQLRQYGRLLGICASIIFLAGAFSMYARYSVIREERDALRTQLYQTTRELFSTATRSPTQARELLAGRSASDDPQPRFDAYDALDAVSSAIPGEIVHNTRRLRIQIDDESRDGDFEIQGTVASIAERDTIAAQLEQHECFTEIKKGPTSPGPRNEGLNYRLEVDIQCPGETQRAPDQRGRNRGRR